MKEHVYWCDTLLNHYTRTWKDRETYWMARERSRQQRDVLVLILDSYDKAKVTLPRYPYGRCPKKPIYERIHRPSTAICCLCLELITWFCLLFVTYVCCIHASSSPRIIPNPDWGNRPRLWCFPLHRRWRHGYWCKLDSGNCFQSWISAGFQQKAWAKVLPT